MSAKGKELEEASRIASAVDSLNRWAATTFGGHTLHRSWRVAQPTDLHRRWRCILEGDSVPGSDEPMRRVYEGADAVDAMAQAASALNCDERAEALEARRG